MTDRKFSDSYAGKDDLDVSLRMDPTARPHYIRPRPSRWRKVICFFTDHRWDVATDHCARCDRGPFDRGVPTLAELCWRIFNPFL